jgi:phosphatidylinositol alpha-1,6-mannosyltransferase
MPQIAEAVPKATLVVAGTGPEASKLKALANKKGARVVFTGRVAEEDAAAVYATSQVFALPVVDRWFGLEVEGLGVVLLEASACGVPCVAGRSGGTPEAVIDNETGFVLDATDRDALVEATVRLLQDRDLAARMGAAGRAHVEREFSDRSLPKPLLDWLAPSMTTGSV